LVSFRDLKKRSHYFDTFLKRDEMPVTKEFLFTLADAAARQTLPRFRQRGVVDNKNAGEFDPVTEADRSAELAIRELIERTFPDHGILGEEHGASGLDRELVWVIDPIDGTRAFISGLPTWGTLIGLQRNGHAIAGIMAQPFTGETYYALNGESLLEWAGTTQILRARKTTKLSDATLFTTTPHLFKGLERRRFDRLESMVQLSRYGADCYAYVMLAAGYVDLVVETALKPYDIVALVPIIENAGGVITCRDGSRPEKAGDIVAAATPELHRAALDVMNS
jgi:histidinol phosphatase-like enzyme (inositol monophosphatase family)